MSLIALVMNLTLGALLVAALGLGWRLERRLKHLRDSHQSFARAVDDLDRAAQRAEQGLADLRAATDEAAETLAGRIEKAKALTMRLDAAIDRAPAPHPLRADATATTATPEGRAARRVGWGAPSAASPSLDRTPHPQPLPSRGREAAPRSRSLDNELFDDGDLRERLALRTASGARR